MDNILEQIQSLTDKFNNLFEVEGLGEPSGDVPPSTNKIKKDKKTKDGKVELVSVEDELFPKEGNAKEQFRQKVIDKINGMIQGTATLEDLLQLVRSKQIKPVKEGFEGAIELAEDLYNYIKKKHGEPKYAGIDSHPTNKSAKLIHKMSDAKGKEYSQEKEKNPDINLYNKRCTTKNTRGEQKTQNRSSKYRKFSDDWRLPKTDDEKITASIRRNKLKPVKEGFEGAIEILEEIILEEIINEVSERTKIDAYKKRANQSKLVGDIAKDTAKWYMDKGAYEPAIEVLKKADTAQKKEFKHRLNTMHHDKAFGQDAYNKAEKELRDERKAKKDVKEAMELTEEIINEVSVGALARATENNVKKRQEAHKKSTEALKKAHDNYEEQSKKHPEDEPALYNTLDKLSSATRKEGEKASHANDLANLNLPKDSKVSANKLFGKADKTYAKRGKEVDKALDKGKGRGDKEFDTPMKKYSRAVDLAVADPVVSRRTNGGANESFEQVISQIEGLIGCLGESKSPDELSSVAKRVLPQREANAKKAYAEVNRVTNLNPYSMVNGKLSQKQREIIANAINKANKANDKVEHAKSYLEKPKEKQPSTEFKFNKILCSLEEAMDIIEATVGKLSTSSANSVESRRKEYQNLADKAQKATGANKVTLNAQKDKAKKRYSHALELNMLHLPKDSKVPANKLFKAADKSVEGRKRQDSNKRYARAWNIADANPLKEALEITENLYKEINKKFNKGELSVDKALELEKKVQDKISPEKRKYDGKELEAEMKSSLEPEIQVNKNLKALRRDDKRRNQGKANYKFTFDYDPRKEANEGLFIEDGRGDLIDDVSKVITGKTVKQHLQDKAKKIIKGRKKKES